MPEPKTTAQKIKETSDKVKKQQDRGQCAYFAFVDEKAVAEVRSGACHADVLRGGSRHTKAIVSRIRRNTARYAQVSEETAISFYDWLFNRSPWSQCFMYKGAKNRWLEGTCVVTANAPANLVQGALIATRNTWEYPQVVDFWKRLVDERIEGNLAFLLAHLTYLRGNRVETKSSGDHHQAIDGSAMHVDGAKAFLQGKAMRYTAAYNKNGKAASEVHRAFNGSRGGGVAVHFKKQFNSFGKTEAKNTNPFHKAKPQNTQGRRSMSFKEFVSFVKELGPKCIGVHNEGGPL